MQDLGYRTDLVARSLRTGTTKAIGVVVDDLLDPVFSTLVRAADGAAMAAGYTIFLGTAVDGPAPAFVDVESMVAHRVDGLIIACGRPGLGFWRELRKTGIPSVVLNGGPPDGAYDRVAIDSLAGFHQVTGHLLDLGHRRIACVRGPAGAPHDADRAAGFRLACREGGLDHADVVELRGDGRFEGGIRAARLLLASGAEVTAIACYNDRTAIGVIRTLRLAGLAVPDDISVTGFDDIAESEWIDPPLTTMTQPTAELARIAVERLVLQLETGPGRPPPPVRVSLPVSLHIRNSSAPPSGPQASERTPT